MRGFFCALFAGILCLESIGGFCRQGYVSEGIREQATHLFHETEEKEAGQLQEDLHLYAQAAELFQQAGAHGTAEIGIINVGCFHGVSPP